MSKLCQSCGETDPTKFDNRRKTLCKECVREKARKRYHQLSEKDKRAYIDRANKKYKKWVKDNPLQYRFTSARNRAKYRKLEFTITLDEIEMLWKKQDGKCFYTNLPMTTCGEDSMTLSLDRKNNALGYISGNVVLCQWRVNEMKRNIEYDEFIKIINLIHSNHG